jgi:hypothetical protein
MLFSPPPPQLFPLTFLKVFSRDVFSNTLNLPPSLGMKIDSHTQRGRADKIILLYMLIFMVIEAGILRFGIQW